MITFWQGEALPKGGINERDVVIAFQYFPKITRFLVQDKSYSWRLNIVSDRFVLSKTLKNVV
jgi:hypothetical protein